jgi:hypothetical protein
MYAADKFPRGRFLGFKSGVSGVFSAAVWTLTERNKPKIIIFDRFFQVGCILGQKYALNRVGGCFL